MPSYMETGPSGLNLQMGSMKEWTFAFSPNVELGARLDLSKELWLRPYGSVGMTFLSNDSMDVQATLQGVGANVASYTSSQAMPDTLLDLGVGVQLYHVKGYELRGEYKAQIASDFLAQEFSARFAIPF